MLIAKLEAIYYLFMGTWPLLHLKSFEAVTGHKTDKWLVKSISWLFVVIGVQLWVAHDVPDIAVLGIGAALAIGGADIYYSTIKKRISYVYTLDAIPQAAFLIAWVIHIV